MTRLVTWATTVGGDARAELGRTACEWETLANVDVHSERVSAARLVPVEDSR
jgi:hypothetical protein